MKQVIQTLIPMNLGGGTWVQDTKGLVTVGAYSEGMVRPDNDRVYVTNGLTIGEAYHTLTEQEMPKHKHPSRAVMETHTQFVNDSYDHTSSLCVGANSAGNNLGWSNFVNDLDNVDNDFAGGGQTHNNTQPSIGVIRWHRTA